MRRYDHRANASEIVPSHGRAVDRNGEELPPPPTGSAFANAVDELSLAANGAEVRLTLDARLQAKAQALFVGHARRGVEYTGSLVAIEPSSGRIRALVNSPSGTHFNRALDGRYPPGSVFKPFIAAAALDAGIDPLFDTPPSGFRPGRATPPIRDVEAAIYRRTGRKWKGFGRIGMRDALVHSSNTYFAQLGMALGTENFDIAVARARLREPCAVLHGTGTTLEGGVCGIPDSIPPARLAPVAIGQGAITVPPLAIAAITCAIADDGVMLSPTISADAKPELRARVFKIESATAVRKMMRDTVRFGTAKGCEIAGLDVCGKTGTAQTGNGDDHAWFTCFAPMNSPRLAVTVIVEHGGFGAEAAMPIVREFLLEARKLGYFKGVAK